MAEFSELPLRYRWEMAMYRWRHVDPLVWTRLAVPLASATVGLVTTAGLYRPAIDKPFERVRESAPAAAAVFRQDGVDAALLVPV